MAESTESLLATQLDERLRSMQQGSQTRSDIEATVAALGHHLGLNGLALNEDGVAQLRIDQELDVMLVHYAQLPGLLVVVPIPEVDAGDVRHLKVLLQANMSWQLTSGGLFSTVPGTDEPALFGLLLTRDRRIADIDRELAALVACAKTWRAALADPPPIPGETSGGDWDAGIIHA
jgi:hypothetical protein